VNDGLIQLFETADAMRRVQAQNLGMFGYGPQECDHRIIASTPLWRLRQYSGTGLGPNVLIIAAPIKHPYIWDLAPTVSAIGYCLRHGLRLYLLEWVPPSRQGAIGGLAEYADAAISAAVAAISRETSNAMPFVMGHSLGGTLAAIFAALHPDRLKGLVLLSAPLCFRAGVSSFRDNLAAMMPSWLPETDVVPGSLLSHLTAVSASQAFIWSRLLDAVASARDSRASGLRLRIERWALDEAALSGLLIRDIFVWLYRENRLCVGTLPVGNRLAQPSNIRVPVLAVANITDDVAPPASVTPFL
jgi:polyhydroxyalkanoate synthase